ncbi:MAG: 2-oxoacid:acceptor oxidoreductase subunit alpha [Myxococcota bacterium]
MSNIPSPTDPAPEQAKKRVEQVVDVVIRFAGDSGDGMQVTGTRFTDEAAVSGHDLRTLPDFPAEIRAPAGTLAGVSSFQVHFSTNPVWTPGDAVDVLVAMNPAALKSHLGGLKEHGNLIVNTDAFTPRNLEKVGYVGNPLEDGSLSDYNLYDVDISRLTATALADSGLTSREIDRCKNFFALGLVFWMYSRKLEHTLDWIDAKFKARPEVAEANRKVLKAGFFFGETAEAFPVRFDVARAKIEPGRYRNITGNKALAIGLVSAAKRSGLELFLGSYPITPASDILHELSVHKHYGVYTMQAEDELAGITAAIGASYGGALGVTTTSGPGLALKSEALNLAVMTELPLVVVNVQRGGPSTGLPTKTEQSDLLQALYGRNGESSVVVLAPSSPVDCFSMAYEAARIALEHMTPVILLSDGYLGNGSEPWQIPDPATLPEIELRYETDPERFHPYARDPETLTRPRVWLGTPGLEHRIGGLEKEHKTGMVSYDPINHERMTRLREEKVSRVAREIPDLECEGCSDGDALLIGWGSTRGAIHGAMETLCQNGHRVGAVHLRFLNPLARNLKEVMERFRHVVIPELNFGQMAQVLRAKTLIDIKSICKVQGQPFLEAEIVSKVESIIQGEPFDPFLLNTLSDLESRQ